MTRDETLLMTSSADLELRVWRLATHDVSCLVFFSLNATFIYFDMLVLCHVIISEGLLGDFFGAKVAAVASISEATSYSKKDGCHRFLL